jgi:hypothetical protein
MDPVRCSLAEVEFVVGPSWASWGEVLPVRGHLVTGTPRDRGRNQRNVDTLRSALGAIAG